jgi:hypothetical protein
MANRDFSIPIKGYSRGLSPDKQPPLTTGYIDNMYPRGTLEELIRLVQRPGEDKIFAAQVGGAALPTVFILSVTTVD